MSAHDALRDEVLAKRSRKAPGVASPSYRERCPDAAAAERADEGVRELARERYQLGNGTPTLRHWSGGWWEWRRSHWVEIEARAARATAYEFTEHALYGRQKSNGETEIVPWSPNRHKVADLLEALAAIVHLPETVNQPIWIDDTRDGVIVACANGLLDVHAREVLPHTPLFFNLTSVPFDYDPEASRPRVWFEFLNDLWPDDDESLNALQEFFGYVISGRLDLHKILLLVGPTRAGKGVIASDLQGANVVARHAVMSLGFSPRAGQLTATAAGQNMPLSESTRQVIDEEVERNDRGCVPRRHRHGRRASRGAAGTLDGTAGRGRPRPRACRRPARDRSPAAGGAARARAAARARPEPPPRAAAVRPVVRLRERRRRRVSRAPSAAGAAAAASAARRWHPPA
jgi:hypothetical protein